MQKTFNNRAFTLVELLMAVAFTVLLMTGVFGFFNVSSQIYSAGIAGQSLQDGANTILGKIIEGGKESDGNVYRLATSAADYIPNNNPGQLYFCQDNPENNPCGPTDATVRYYTLDPTSTQLLYYHPTTNPLGYDVLYTAPPQSTITLRFDYASVATNSSSVVEIDVALTQNAQAGITNTSTIANGSESTFVLLRNHP